MKKYLISKIILLLGLCTASGLLHAQLTGTENYVQSISYLDSTKISDPSKKRIETVQYFDGLGRPRQTVNVKGSPLGKDVVTALTYDNLGRQAREYFPVPQSGTTGGAIYPQTSGSVPYPVADPGNIYAGEKIFSEKQFESSPLNKIKQLTQPGNAWSTKPVQYTESANKQSDNVKKYETVTSWHAANKIYTSTVSQSSFYSEGQLYKNTTADEDGNKTIEFKNSNGQTILLRKVLSTTENADTYYVYNEYDQLAYIIPAGAAGSPLNTTTLDNLCYQYKYDSRYRLVEKKLPGKGWEYMIYDKQDRLILTQDAVLRTTTNNFNAKGWLFTKYDQSDRIVYTGFFSSTATRVELQKAVNNITVNAANNESRSDTTPFTTQELTIYYTKNAFPTSGMTVLTVNYYDTYAPGLVSEIPVSILGQKVLKQPGQGTVKNTNGLALSSFVKNIEDVGWARNYNWYDTKGRVIGTYSMNYLGGHTTTETEYDFGGAIKQTITKHKRSRIDTEFQIKERFIYDGQNRVLKHYHQVDTNPEELLAENTYNEIGQLINKKTGNTSGSPLESIDYAYNIRGWQTKVNDPSNLGSKLFAYELKYNNPQYTNKSTGRFNGNISEVDWKASGDKLRRYNYNHDALERLKTGIYSEPNSTIPQNDYYNETLAYDINGNILSLQRNRLVENMPSAQLMDNLSYNYTAGKLNSITDNSGIYGGYPETSGNPFTYDENGNMKSHVDKGILQIDYNHLNLPSYLKFDKEYYSHDSWDIAYNENTKYMYRADGAKVQKIHTFGSGRTSIETTRKTEYFDGFQYEEGVLQFVPTSEGYYDFVQNKYIYQYKDDVGNIRLAYYKDASGNLKIDRTTNFYPFGLEFGGELNIGYSISPNYTYSTQGQEKQRDTGWSSYKWRNYDPAMARFFNVDPLAEDYNTWSPYVFSGNRVVDSRELEGLEPFSTKREQDLPGNEMEFAEMIGGAINSVRAAVSNSVVRTVNTVTNDAVRNKYQVNSQGQLVLEIGVPKESFKEKVVNGSFDLATIAMAAAGGPEGVLMSQGGKAPIIKGVEEVKAAAKIPSIASQRQGAVRKAWKDEKKLVESGEDGTRRWTDAETKELKEKGKVKGYVGHHINNVKHHPDKAGDPANIEFVTRKEHLQRHNGNFKNETTGDLIKRK
ncbi:DUF6443 domain-containing protein [Chryseobacterium angstadtii]|uniref:DUF6443 domain-containing protein n=1 Tax=Chryseobacterium angstadtii TaxID=558151 RepID=UPI00065AB567|nr:DUF6443 domain-containing protein [Chryseobacterium angstadtii]